MKMVEVSAICQGYAINPAGDEVFMHFPETGCWMPLFCNNAMTIWSAICMNRNVHRGIFNIKVYGD